METEGWPGVCASDHFWVGGTRYPHVFVAATQMACATEHVQITSSFCNNLFRSPVEFAQGAMALQEASRGRFEAGLGAGWAQDEIEAVGWDYPAGPTRVSMYVEALQIVAQLFASGQCTFAGDHYSINISGEHALATSAEPPLLVGSAGGPRSLREVTPLVDRVEIKANARATRGGHLDFALLASVAEDELRRNVDRIKSIRPDVPIGIFILTAVGEDPVTQGLKQSLGNGFLGRFCGAADDVAQALLELEGMGIDRVQLTELAPGSHSLLAPVLLGQA
jgi:alkanesulfonate monooxygenase SsuD/methylene tetrahydromethanopterin reductase-like flavin-dependent oxidoreductase (luciferase family)